jgi:hypothetical protein
MLAHICKPSYLGGGDRKIKVQDQPRQSYCKTLSERQTKSKKDWGVVQAGKHEALSSIPNTPIRIAVTFPSAAIVGLGSPESSFGFF